MKNFFSPVIFLGMAGTFFSSCINDKGNAPLPASGYPPEIETIMLNKCATAGCHNTQSAEGASGLDLSTYNAMFKGNRAGAVTIPHRSELSPTFTFCNLYSDLGDTNQLPKMPYNASLLSFGEVSIIKNWIDDGALDINGKPKFPDVPERRKFYIANQGCDLVSVFDADERVAYKVIDVGNVQGFTESAHMIRMAPDNKYWYTVFIGGSVVQKFDAVTDSLVATLDLQQPHFWSAMAISNDSKYGFLTGFEADGSIVYIDLQNMTIVNSYIVGINGGSPSPFVNPHGVAFTKNADTAYVTGQYGNFIYKIPVNDFASYTTFTFDGRIPNSQKQTTFDPHEVAFSPDYSKYFVTCEYSNEVRVYRTSDDYLLAAIPNIYDCKEMSFSLNTNYLFVSCFDDYNSFPGKRGSVAIIDYENLTLVKKVYTGTQPHGLAVDDIKNICYVANTNNAGKDGVHHVSFCGGKNGSVVIIDLNTLDLVPGYKNEVLTFPYSVIIKN